ncbi:MAG TPA: HIT family protein [Thermoplasmata archaeon]
MQLDEAREEPTRRGGGLSSVGRKKADCPICRRGRPLDVVAVLSSAWVSAPPRAALPGYVAVVSKRHVVEPFELPVAAGFAFWQDVLLVSKALADLLAPVKMNYEIHGNTIPHLHVHLYPRFQADPFVGRPIDSREASFVRSKAERTRIGRAIRRAAIGSHSARTAHR